VVRKDAEMLVKMGDRNGGLPSIPTMFKAGRVLDRAGYLPGAFEDWYAKGLLLEPAD